MLMIFADVGIGLLSVPVSLLYLVRGFLQVAYSKIVHSGKPSPFAGGGYSTGSFLLL